MELSQHFTLKELTHSNTAIRKGIDNTPSQEVINNLKELCVNVLEPLRQKLGKPLRVTSGYRSPKLNRLIGGAKKSQHIEGKAADIQVDGMSTEELFQLAIATVPFDQAIQEFDSWLHISWNGSKNRNQKLRATKHEGETIYTEV